MTWKRARSDEKKTKRKQAIYEAALKLFKNKGYENVSLNAIAAEVGFAKSNVYSYFSSREEIYLAIFSDLFKVWLKECLEALAKMPPGISVPQFTEQWVDIAIRHKSLANLAPLLFISLEKNSSYDQLVAFKELSLSATADHTLAMMRLFPDLSEEHVSRFLMHSHAMISTFWATSSYNEVLDKVYEQERFAQMRPNFRVNLINAIEILIYGMKGKENSHG